MFVKLPTIVLVVVAASLCLAAPAVEVDGIATAWGGPRGGKSHYPHCGAPICKRDGAHVGLLSDAEAELVNRAADECSCPEGDVAFYFDGHCECTGEVLSSPLEGRSETSVKLSEFEKRRITQAQLTKCATINCKIRPPSVKIAKDDGKCDCVPPRLVGSATIVGRDFAGFEGFQERDVQLNQTIQIDQTTQIDCRRRRGCPPWGHPEIVRGGNCLCVNNKKMTLTRDTLSVEKTSTPDCASIARCPGGQHPILKKGQCVCVPDTKKRDHQYGIPDALNCDAIAKCPGDKFPITNADNMCECVPFTDPVRDCASIGRCPNGNIPITNTDGSCECFYLSEIPFSKRDETEWIDCYSTARCPGDQYPITNAQNQCECVSIDAPKDCGSIAKCSYASGNVSPIGNADNTCQCWIPFFDSIQKRDAQYDFDTPSMPLDCASIAKCPGGQHPVNNASDGMCECVDDDAEDVGMPDCASIAKCPGDQHAVFNNSMGMCQCIPDGTLLDCPTIAKCSDGAVPMNYEGNCVCVPEMA